LEVVDSEKKESSIVVPSIHLNLKSSIIVLDKCHVACSTWTRDVKLYLSELLPYFLLSL